MPGVAGAALISVWTQAGCPEGRAERAAPDAGAVTQRARLILGFAGQGAANGKQGTVATPATAV